MNSLTVITQFTGFTALVSFLWLLSRAFNRHTGWGLAVLLFSPLSALAYGIKYWKNDRLPLLAYLSTTVTAFALCLYLFTSWGGLELLHASQQVQQGLATQSLTKRDTEALMTISKSFDEQSGLDTQSWKLMKRAQREIAMQEEMRAAEERARIEADSKQPFNFDNITKKVKPEQERYRLTYVPINIADAKNYVGSTVKITRKNVVEKEYRLVGASGNRIELTQRSGSGSYTFRYRHSDIEKIRVLTKRPY
jgi:hypothetical protein